MSGRRWICASSHPTRALLALAAITLVVAPAHIKAATGACAADTNPNDTSVPAGSQLTGLSQYFVTARDFGAVGDGVHDDTVAIQEALNCALQLGNTTVYLDSGTYLTTASLQAGSWTSSPATINIVGNGATLLTAIQGQASLLIQGYLSNGLIQGITFRNTHPLTTLDTRGIEFAGGAQNLLNWTIRHCTFEDVSRGILVSGVTGLLITNNNFVLDNGRDSGSSNMNDPNVGVWLFNNYPNGIAVNVEITGNVYDGCGSGKLTGSVSKRCGDGFVFGKGVHALVHGNVLRHFSFEGIYLDRVGNTGITSPLPSSIHDNDIDATMVPGDISGGGQWGIRSDDDYSSVINNTILSAVNGIMVYGVALPTNITGSVILGNQVFMSGNAKERVGNGILMAGVSSPSVSSNTVVFAASTVALGSEAAGIYLTGDNPAQFSTAASITNNKIVCYAHPVAGQFTGVFLQWSSAWTITSNNISGCSAGFHLMNFGNPTPSTTTLTGANSLVGNSHPSQVTN